MPFKSFNEKRTILLKIKHGLNSKVNFPLGQSRDWQFIEKPVSPGWRQWFCFCDKTSKEYQLFFCHCCNFFFNVNYSKRCVTHTLCHLRTGCHVFFIIISLRLISRKLKWTLDGSVKRSQMNRSSCSNLLCADKSVLMF